MIHREVGYDAGKKTKGRKRHLWVETLGLLMVVVVTAASVPEREGAKARICQDTSVKKPILPFSYDLGRWGLSRRELHALGHGYLSLDN